MSARVPSLTLRELNRALLARQFLLKRQKLGAVDAVEQLACLQGQWAPSPYVALWSRVSGFEREQLTRPIDRGEIVKATLMRATLHLVSAAEYPTYSLATMEGRFGAWRPPGGPAYKDLDRLHRAVMAFAGKIPRTRTQIQEFIGGHIPPSAAKDERLRNWFSWAAVATSGLVWEAAGAHFEHRHRVIAPTHRRAVHTKNAIVEAVFMLDGFAAGTWRQDRAKNEAVLAVAPFARLTSGHRVAVEAEGRELLSFLAPDAKTVGLRFA